MAETQNVAAARLAFLRAVALGPISSDFWLEVARVSAQHGLTEEAQPALLHLNRLNSELAPCLAVILGPVVDQKDDPALNACSAL